MIILCDCDGVLADFVGGLCERMTACGMPKAPTDLKHWELRESFTDEELRAAFDIMREPGFCNGLAWYEGAKDFLRELQLLGEVHIVTSHFDGSETWERERKAWLAPHISRERVHGVLGKYKYLMHGDVLIEDHPQTAHDWLVNNPNGVALLVDRPWNGHGAKEWHAHRRMYRVKSYDEALRTIGECLP